MPLKPTATVRNNDHDWVNVLDARSLPIFLTSPASIDTTNRSAECMQALNGTTAVVTCSDGHDTWLHPRCFEKAKDKDLKKCALAGPGRPPAIARDAQTERQRGKKETRFRLKRFAGKDLVRPRVCWRLLLSCNCTRCNRK